VSVTKKAYELSLVEGLAVALALFLCGWVLQKGALTRIRFCFLMGLCPKPREC
jgi:hypothetical protein